MNKEKRKSLLNAIASAFDAKGYVEKLIANKGLDSLQGIDVAQRFKECFDDDGFLTKEKPGNNVARALHDVVEANANPYKIDIGEQLFKSVDDQKLFRAFDDVLKNVPALGWLDRDRHGLQMLGAW